MEKGEGNSGKEVFHRRWYLNWVLKVKMEEFIDMEYMVRYGESKNGVLETIGSWLLSEENIYLVNKYLLSDY